MLKCREQECLMDGGESCGEVKQEDGWVILCHGKLRGCLFHVHDISQDRASRQKSPLFWADSCGQRGLPSVAVRVGEDAVRCVHYAQGSRALSSVDLPVLGVEFVHFLGDAYE